jgi:uncharacterized protein YpmB
MRIILVVIGIVIVGSLAVGFVVFNKPHRSVEGEEAIVITADKLFLAYETNEIDANQKYLDNVLEVTGVVTEILKNQSDQSVIVLAADNPLFGVTCTTAEEIKNIHVGMVVTMKGICTGYLSDVVITNGIVVQSRNTEP